MTGGDSPASGLGKVLITPQCENLPHYKINSIATGLDRSLGTTYTMKKVHEIWQMECKKPV